MRRSVKQAETRREEILDAAERLIISKGYQATTMEGILAAVGIAKGTLYHHFRSKEQILEGIIDRTVAAMVARVRQAAAADLPPAPRLLAALQATRVEGVSSELAEHFNATRNAEFHQLSVVRTVRQVSPVLAEIVADGVASADFHTSDPLTACEILLTAGGMLLDEGIFSDEPDAMPRRSAGLVSAAERLLGCAPGALTAPLDTQPTPEDH